MIHCFSLSCWNFSFHLFDILPSLQFCLFLPAAHCDAFSLHRTCVQYLFRGNAATVLCLFLHFTYRGCLPGSSILPARCRTCRTAACGGTVLFLPALEKIAALPFCSPGLRYRSHKPTCRTLLGTFPAWVLRWRTFRHHSTLSSVLFSYTTVFYLPPTSAPFLTWVGTFCRCVLFFTDNFTVQISTCVSPSTCTHHHYKYHLLITVELHIHFPSVSTSECFCRFTFYVGIFSAYGTFLRHYTSCENTPFTTCSYVTIFSGGIPCISLHAVLPFPLTSCDFVTHSTSVSLHLPFITYYAFPLTLRLCHWVTTTSHFHSVGYTFRFSICCFHTF